MATNTKRNMNFSSFSSVFVDKFNSSISSCELSFYYVLSFRSL